MSTFETSDGPVAVDVSATASLLRVALEDGREIAVPLEWFPRLRDASEKSRGNCRFIGRGEGIHWPEIDEDISVAGLLSRSRPGLKPRAA